MLSANFKPIDAIGLRRGEGFGGSAPRRRVSGSGRAATHSTRGTADVGPTPIDGTSTSSLRGEGKIHDGDDGRCDWHCLPTAGTKLYFGPGVLSIALWGLGRLLSRARGDVARVDMVWRPIDEKPTSGAWCVWCGIQARSRFRS